MADEKGKILKLFKFDKLFENLTGYIETQIELVKLDLKEQTQEGLENIFQVVLMMFLASFVVLFMSFGISVLLNSVLNSKYLGYLLVAFVYLILFIVILLDKNKSFGKWVSLLIFKNKE